MIWEWEEKYAYFWLILIDGKAALNLSVCILIIQGNYKCYLQKIVGLKALTHSYSVLR